MALKAGHGNAGGLEVEPTSGWAKSDGLKRRELARTSLVRV